MIATTSAQVGNARSQGETPGWTPASLVTSALYVKTHTVIAPGLFLNIKLPSKMPKFGKMHVKPVLKPACNCTR
ncbi:hypothetical protein FIBSPDRAFT_865093 [Athelia psychrophila]|uniref:Uncharacterized protein n=1 Tax=Athelia psychrophila TaxID=1759441 RepID=A0A166G3N4_9AGAM|nr:hypothetical protein FIBSPDRAFT_865093 [Fibularhizoctonia sp. CBS 109695]